MDTLPNRLQEALGREYRVEGELGGGGMSRVFAAVEVELDRRVVIKVLPPEMAADVSMERFRREIQVAAGLQHPHIVPLLTAGSAGDLVYYVMPLVEGESLRVRLEREGPLPVPAAIAILRDVADALAYAHRRGVVHRDIKPDNVLASGEHALVTDFGVAKALGHSTDGTGSATLTHVGVAIGTPAYMAPEQAAGEPDVDHRADIYAVGALAYELLTGRPPFVGHSYQQILAAQLTERATPVGALRADVPAAFERLVARCLERDPGERWQTAGELYQALAGLVTPPGVAPAPGRSRPGVGRLLRQAGLAAVAVAALAWGAVTVRGLRRGQAPSATAIAVLPFAVRGGADVEYLGEGIVNLLATSLDGAGDLRSVDPRALLGVVRREAGGPLDPESGARVAARLGAGLFVLGDIVQAGDRLRIDAALYAPARGAEPAVRATAEGAPGQLFMLVDSLAVQLLAGRGSGPGARVTRIAAVTTGSLAALKAYLEGERHFRAGRFAPAVEAFEAAVASDTGFALAYYRLSIAAEWALRPDRAETAAESAVRHAGRLSERDRRLLDALRAARRGDAMEAERLYRAILAVYPDDVEAWLQVGEILFHMGRLFGRPLQGSREPFERVVSFEPGHATALIHLARLAAARADQAATDSLTQRVLRLHPGGDRALEMQGLRIVAGVSGADVDEFEAATRTGDPTLVFQGMFSLLTFGRDRRVPERLLRGMVDSARSAEVRTTARAWLAFAQAGQGRWREAHAGLAVPGADRRGEILAYDALLAVLPFATVPADTLRRLQQALVAWDAAAEPPSPVPNAYFDIHNGLHPAIRLYLLGRVAAVQGDTAATRRHAEALERVGGAPASRAVAAGLARGLRARLLAARGRHADAVAVLEPTARLGGYEPKLFSPFVGLTTERFLVGELLDSLGRGDDARVWLGSMITFGAFDLALEAPARLRMARSFERAGLADSATVHYMRFLELWQNCDPELRPVVDSARAALARLAAESTR